MYLDDRVMGYLLGTTANRKNQPKKKNKAEMSWRSEEHFDIKHRDTEFGVCPAGFQSCFGPIFPHYLPFPSFWKSNVYPMPFYVGCV